MGCPTCGDTGIVPATGRGSDGAEPCPDCALAVKRVLVSAFSIAPEGPYRVHLAFSRDDDPYLMLPAVDESVKHGSFARVDGEYAGCGTHRWELAVWGTPSELAKLGPDRRDKPRSKHPDPEPDVEEF